MNCVFEGDFARIPELTKEGIKRYVEHRCRPGSFLSAVICGELYEAMRRADPENRECIILIALWFDRNFPGLCGPSNFVNWIGGKS
jgi:hypothetical protein